MWMLTEERKNELLRQRDNKVHELKILKDKSNSDLWLEDLDEFLAKLDEVEEKERKDEAGTNAKDAKKAVVSDFVSISYSIGMDIKHIFAIEKLVCDDVKKGISLIHFFLK